MIGSKDCTLSNNKRLFLTYMQCIYMFEVILIKLFGVLLSLKEEVYERGRAGEE